MTLEDELLVAVTWKDDHEKVRELIAKGVNIHARSNWPVQIAAGNGFLESIKVLVEAGADIHAQEDWAFRDAVHEGRLEVVKYLIHKGANINAKNNYAYRWIDELDTPAHRKIKKVLDFVSTPKTTA